MYNYNDDYVILFDEDGQPYIAHANLREMAGKVGGAVKRGVSALKGMKRPGAKYYQRLDDPKRPGKYLYFYSKEEYDRYIRAQSGANQSKRVISELEKAYKANPTKENQARLLRARAGAMADQQRAKDAETSARNRYNSSLRGRIDNATDRISDNVNNTVSNARDKAQRMREDIRKKIGVGARANYEKESGEAAEVRERSQRILQGIRDARARGDTESEARLRRTYDLYNKTVEKENREAREAKDAYDSSLAGKINNMISRARKGGQDVKDKASDVVDLIRYNAPELKDMTADQIKKMNNSIKSAIGTAGNYAKAGREAIQNTTGVGLRNTVSSLAQQLSDAQQVAETVTSEAKAARDAGDNARANQLGDTFRLINDHINNLQKEYDQVRGNYDTSPARKVNDTITDAKAISQATAQKLMDKFNEGKSLTKDEMRQLFAFFGNFMGGGN